MYFYNHFKQVNTELQFKRFKIQCTEDDFKPSLKQIYLMHIWDPNRYNYSRVDLGLMVIKKWWHATQRYMRTGGMWYKVGF